MKSPAILISFLFVLLGSCSEQESEDDFVARVYDRFLTRQELAENIPATLSADDSLKRAKVYINSWVKERVVLEKAEFNLNREDPRFRSKVDAYLNDLLIFEYEQQLVNQNLETEVSEQEARAFYEENKENFVLKDYVVKARYLVMDAEDKSMDEGYRKFKRYNESDSLELIDLVDHSSAILWDQPDEWLFLPELLEIVPINFTYFEEKVKQKRFFDKVYNGKRYLLHVRDFKVRDGQTPFELEYERIQSIIRNSRKQKLLQDMRDGLFQEALEGGQIEIRE